MAALVFRLVLLALGLGLVETGLLDGMARGSMIGWLTMGGGLALLLAGGAGFIGPLLAREGKEPRR